MFALLAKNYLLTSFHGRRISPGGKCRFGVKGMKDDTRKRIEVAANAAIIITAVFLSAAAVKYLISRPNPQPPIVSANSSLNGPNRPEIPPGTRLSIEGVDWSKNGQTLLVADSDKCHFCTESAPFYQRLVQQHSRTRLIAVVPQSVEEGRNYLSKLNVGIDDVRQAQFSSLGVRGTPTLILLDNNGAAVKSWVGRLPPNGEAEVISALQ